MKFDLKKPCTECPFTRGPKAVRVTVGRTRDLIDAMVEEPGSTFSCHKTVDYREYDDDGEERKTGVNEQHCAGATLYAMKQGRLNRPLRMAAALQLFSPSQMEGHDQVFDDEQEMLDSAIRR